MSDPVASRELDARVAEEVMGWRLHATGRMAGFWEDSTGVFHVEVSKFSSDAGAAFQVVEKMRERGWLVVVKVMPREASFILEGSRSEYDAPCADALVGKGKVCCELKWMGDGWRHDEWVLTDTAPLAICLAALRAIEGASDER